MSTEQIDATPPTSRNWLFYLVAVLFLFYLGVHVWGVSINLDRIPWRILVPIFALFCFCHSVLLLGWKRAVTLLGLAVSVSFCFEYVGESTGLIFGKYHYTELLGHKINSRIPVIIPFAWYMMFYPSYVVTNILTEGTPDARRGGFVWLVWMSAISALIMTAWDVTMDPIMSWSQCSDCSPAWVWDDGGIHFGVPLKNYQGWLITSFVVFFLYRSIETRIPRKPGAPHMPRLVAFMPVAAYGTMALIDTWLGSRQIEDSRLIAPFVMGIPFLLAVMHLVAGGKDRHRADGA